MFHNAAGDDMLLQITTEACQRRRAVVTGSKSVTLLEYCCHICIPPIRVPFHSQGILLNITQIRCKLLCQLMEYSCWDLIRTTPSMDVFCLYIFGVQYILGISLQVVVILGYRDLILVLQSLQYVYQLPLYLWVGSLLSCS